MLSVKQYKYLVLIEFNTTQLETWIGAALIMLYHHCDDANIRLVSSITDSTSTFMGDSLDAFIMNVVFLFGRDDELSCCSSLLPSSTATNSSSTFTSTKTTRLQNIPGDMAAPNTCPNGKKVTIKAVLMNSLFLSWMALLVDPTFLFRDT